MLENEEVDPEILLGLLEARFPAFPQQFRETLPKMDKREYDKNFTATLDTWKSFFDGRKEYLESNNLPTELSAFCAKQCEKAGEGGDLSKQDYTKLQEVLRFKQKD
tara:strand:- start:232 stop:549 length:318 start_codon:yes stop_codon:yes gene_type:complete